MSANKVYVVTGANRGLGLGLVQSLLARPKHTVIATVRSEEALRSLQEEIKSTTRAEGSTLQITQLDFSAAIAPDKVAEAFAKLDNVKHIDVLILNAGMAPAMSAASETTAEDLRAVYETNTIAPLLVFQGLRPLLHKALSTAKVIWISSSVGSIGDMDPFGAGGYGPARAAQNWLARSLHLEFNKVKKDAPLIVIPLHPGWVQTRAGQHVVDQWQPSLKAVNYNIEKPPTTVEESVSGMLKVIDGATEAESGTFLSFDGKTVPW